MAKIKVAVSHTIKDGTEIVFPAPCDCDKVDGLVVYHPGGSNDFFLSDAHRNFLKRHGNLFLEDALVKVILDVTHGFAYIQNADTNSYLEDRLAALGVEDSTFPGSFYRNVGGSKEWLNPPMYTSLEYRTAEKCEGKSVYVNRVNIGFMPSFDADVGYGWKTSEVDLCPPGATLVDFDVLLQLSTKEEPSKYNYYKFPLAHPDTGEIVASAMMTENEVMVTTYTDWSGYISQIYVTAKYTKN